jgi:hypothetical protein
VTSGWDRHGHVSDKGRSSVACRNRKEHFGSWVVTTRRANYSAFNGYHRTPSDYSEVRCTACSKRWRTKAAYVDQLPDEVRLPTE